MYLIPLVIFVFPCLAFLSGLVGSELFKRLYIAPLIVFTISLTAQLVYFNFSFFTWTCVYTGLAFLGGISARFLVRKFQPSQKVKKITGMILLGIVLIPVLILTGARPVNAVLMERGVKSHLQEKGYSMSDIQSITTYHNGKLNTGRTKPTIAEVVFTDDPAHSYRYIKLKEEDKIVQMCEYEKSPNFFTNEYTKDRPHMIRNCLE